MQCKLVPAGYFEIQTISSSLVFKWPLLRSYLYLISVTSLIPCFFCHQFETLFFVTSLKPFLSCSCQLVLFLSAFFTIQSPRYENIVVRYITEQKKSMIKKVFLTFTHSLKHFCLVPKHDIGRRCFDSCFRSAPIKPV